MRCSFFGMADSLTRGCHSWLSITGTPQRGLQLNWRDLEWGSKHLVKIKQTSANPNESHTFKVWWLFGRAQRGGFALVYTLVYVCVSANLIRFCLGFFIISESKAVISHHRLSINWTPSQAYPWKWLCFKNKWLPRSWHFNLLVYGCAACVSGWVTARLIGSWVDREGGRSG